MPKRALFIVTHLLGVGHLARTAALARAFVQAGQEATLVSGGMPAPLVPMDGVRLVQLPPVRSDGVNFTRLLDGEGMPVGDTVLAARRQVLLDAYRATKPDIVVTELFPFGRRQLAAEFLALLEHARSRSRRPRVVASIRDILAAPSRRERVAQTHARLREFYDAVLVHGDPQVVPLEASWPDAGMIADLLQYTGYIDAGTGSGGACTADAREEILVSGGGSAAGLPLYEAALAAARHLPELRWRILAGHGLPEDRFQALARSASPNAILERARADFPTLLERCAVSVSQAGYNTMMDLLRAGARSILVPFEDGGETEQRIRAEQFAARQLAILLPEARLSGPALADAVIGALGLPRPEPSRIDCSGLERSVEILLAMTEPGT